MKDAFRGDTSHLISSIEALLSLDAEGALVPHGIGGHARDLLSSAAVRLSASRQEGWISVEERMPGPGVIVLAFFRNSYGKGRVVRAHHAPKHTIEAGHWDEDAETDNTDDGSFEPEGWYEDPAVGETLSFISPQSDGAVSHWRPMPAAPQEAQGDRHGE